MRSSRPDKQRRTSLPVQMGLDFIEENQYIIAPFEGDIAVESNLFEKLEEKINGLLSRLAELKDENQQLLEENNRLKQDREGIKGRIDDILSRLEGV